MKVELTNDLVASLKPRPDVKAYRVYDSKCKGLSVYVPREGVKSFYAKTARQNYKAIGRFPEMSVDQARAVFETASVDPEHGYLKIKRPDGGLTEKQERFCIEYARTGRSIDSYVIAYGSSLDTARSEASSVLRNPKVLKRIESLTGKSPLETVSTNAPWAKNLTRNSETAGRMLAFRVLELVEPHLRAAIFQATEEMIRYELSDSPEPSA